MNKMVIVIFILVLFSCKESSPNVKTTENLQQIIGGTIKLPINYKSIIYDRDTVINIDKDKCKVLVYYNKKGCTACKLKQLIKWKQLINTNKNLETEFIFIFNTKNNIEELVSSLLLYKFDFPVMCDTIGEFETLNLLPKDDLFHVFLLDKNNITKLAGTPINNDKMWNLYVKQIIKLNN